MTERNGDACRTAAHRACVARGAAAGFGPVSDAIGNDVQIACLENADVLLRPNAAISAWGCSRFPERAWDDECDEVPRKMCGQYGGYGPVEPMSGSDDSVEIVCPSH